MKTPFILHRSAAAVLILAVFALVPMAHGDVSKVSSLRLEQNAGSSRYVIEQTGSAAYQEFLLNNPRRLVVDIVGARHGLESHSHAGDGRLVKAVRTSQFTNDPDEVTRVVFDLTDDAKYKVSRSENRVEISFFSDTPPSATSAPMQASFGSSWDVDVTPKAMTSAPEKTPEKAEVAEPVKTEWTAPAIASQPKAVTKAQPVTTQPQVETWSLPKTVQTPAAKPAEVASANPWASGHTAPARVRTYPAELAAYQQTGQTTMSNDRITMDVQGADIKTVLRSISEFSGQNIVAGPDVEGPVTVHLEEVPWREAMDIVLKANGYGSREEYGIVRVRTLDKLHSEELDIAQVAQKKEELEPMITKVMELNFTNAAEMSTAMDKVTTQRGNISVEKGTNSVIINDIPKVVERIAAMIANLDKRVQQVEIVARMVDVDVEATREIGVRWDFMNIMSTDINAAADAVSGKSLSEPFGALRVGSVNSWGDVMGTIEALERENKADIISNPRITTADNVEANILVGKEVPLIVSDEAGNPITELKKIGVTLRVTPHVNSDNTITLDLHPEISELSSQATVQGGIIISLTEADTRVLVANGETAVIGGLVQEVESRLETGIPVIKDIPILGGLFRFKSTTKKKRELIIFVTPRIVDIGTPGQS